MPKAFSDGERAEIVSRLETAAAEVMASGSIRKASVEELAAEAGISKGAFYLFFPSKELLFFSVIMKKHEEIENAIIGGLKALRHPGKDDVIAIILEYFRATYESFFPRLMSGGELVLLMRRLPEETVAAHLIDDDDFLRAVVGAVPALSKRYATVAVAANEAGTASAAGASDEARLSDVRFFSSAFRAVFMLGLHRAEIGEDQFDRVVKAFVESTVEKMFKGVSHD